MNSSITCFCGGVCLRIYCKWFEHGGGTFQKVPINLAVLTSNPYPLRLASAVEVVLRGTSECCFLAFFVCGFILSRLVMLYVCGIMLLALFVFVYMNVRFACKNFVLV